MQIGGLHVIGADIGQVFGRILLEGQVILPHPGDAAVQPSLALVAGGLAGGKAQRVEGEQPVADHPRGPPFYGRSGNVSAKC